MSDDAKVLYEKRDRIATVTLNRPEVKNAIDPQMDEELAAIWSDFEADAEVDVAIWTGAGDAFCAGADRTTWVAQWLDSNSLTIREAAAKPGFGGLTRGFHRLRKPVIAAVNGWALGGGLELALACDIRIASERAMFGLPLVRYGFHTGDGGIARLVDICGLGVALDIQLSAEPIDARRALECNLVTRVVPHEQLSDAARALAQQVVAHDQVAVRSLKETTLDMVGRSLDDQLRVEALSGYSMAARASDVIAAFQAE